MGKDYAHKKKVYETAQQKQLQKKATIAWAEIPKKARTTKVVKGRHDLRASDPPIEDWIKDNNYQR